MDQKLLEDISKISSSIGMPWVFCKKTTTNRGSREFALQVLWPVANDPKTYNEKSHVSPVLAEIGGVEG